jgi:hypothetical protein
VPVNGDAAAAALAESLRLLVAAIPRGWERQQPGILAAVTGSEAPTLNGVWVYGMDAAPGDIADLLDDVAATGCRIAYRVDRPVLPGWRSWPLHGE